MNPPLVQRIEHVLPPHCDIWYSHCAHRGARRARAKSKTGAHPLLRPRAFPSHSLPDGRRERPTVRSDTPYLPWPSRLPPPTSPGYCLRLGLARPREHRRTALGASHCRGTRQNSGTKPAPNAAPKCSWSKTTALNSVSTDSELEELPA